MLSSGDAPHRVGLLTLPSFHHPDRNSHILQAAQKASQRLYVFSPHPTGPGGLNFLTRMYNSIAHEAPCMDLVPLLAGAGWTVENVSALEDLEVLLSSPLNSKLVAHINSTRERAKLEALPVAFLLPNGGSGGQVGQENSDEGGEECDKSTACVTEMEVCAVGGTFDHMHAGHRLLLVNTALATSKTLYVGITVGDLLVKKKNFELLESYEVRAAAVVKFLKSLRPSLKVIPGPLSSDMSLAGTMKEIEGLIVSRETLPVTRAIQQFRQELGFPDLKIVIVDLVGAQSQELDAEKLSSSTLRQQIALGSSIHCG
eukprot:CAMPEP_0196571530 /NCGR_PEP_ID=MMETSP1081-20130531/1687_1 /TAXON_ID=36882 /ORGANISM="Pyramimonas amylifera, Strain CCMP720" /LENGTH=313 /DNA_ID=CAMNT_0041888511 /DNA_START=125 /DNA_END=1066 /DNA_ORIENTATION=-